VVSEGLREFFAASAGVAGALVGARITRSRPPVNGGAQDQLLTPAPDGLADRPHHSFRAPLLIAVQALAMLLPGIGSARRVRQAGAPKGSAKYCVSCTTCS